MIDVVVVLKKGTTLAQIEEAIKKEYLFLDTMESGNNSFFIRLRHELEVRSLFVSFENETHRNTCIGANVLVMLSKRGNAVEILKYLCETFGGYLNEGDSDNDEDYYPINI